MPFVRSYGERGHPGCLPPSPRQFGFCQGLCSRLQQELYSGCVALPGRHPEGCQPGSVPSIHRGRSCQQSSGYAGVPSQGSKKQGGGASGGHGLHGGAALQQERRCPVVAALRRGDQRRVAGVVLAVDVSACAQQCLHHAGVAAVGSRVQGRVALGVRGQRGRGPTAAGDRGRQQAPRLLQPPRVGRLVQLRPLRIAHHFGSLPKRWWASWVLM
mmetsp:Transcript_29447/g.83048  ORF Transcript_29447/g.83048 Transcript_29447/m.83048 type:complete len:214 (+) Transcript_29447:1545-2186(+)